MVLVIGISRLQRTIDRKLDDWNRSVFSTGHGFLPWEMGCGTTPGLQAQGLV